ncbi:MAG: hypothetical protein SPL22_13240, partial [Treponema sp.]|uniref:hypothetical protein n=1 Tax=Treponema sp. TaxID=166 RepID=UPI002A91E05A
SKPQASLLHVVCACNYIRLPLTRQHKPSVFVSRFTSSRRFLKYPTSSKLDICPDIFGNRENLVGHF